MRKKKVLITGLDKIVDQLSKELRQILLEDSQKSPKISELKMIKLFPSPGSRPFNSTRTRKRTESDLKSHVDVNSKFRIETDSEDEADYYSQDSFSKHGKRS